MIHFFLVINRQGRARIVKWFDQYSYAEQQKIISEVHRLVSSRDSKRQSNFVDFRQDRLVYRRYAGLYFVTSIDTLDSQLSNLEAIHFFVEVLDTYFNSVCELDLVFNFYKVYLILDEVFLAGHLQDLSKAKVLDRLTQLDRLG